MIHTKQKRVRLHNGKTIVIDVPENQKGENPFKDASKYISKIPNIQPCD